MITDYRRHGWSSGEDTFGGRSNQAVGRVTDSRAYAADVLTTDAAFYAAAEDWGDLLKRSAAPSPFASWEWAWSWWQTFGHERSLRTITLRDQHGILIAVAPMYCTIPRTKFASRELRMVGDNGRDAEGMTDEPTLLAAAGHEVHALTSIIRCIKSLRDDVAWDSVKLRVGVPEAGCLTEPSLRLGLSPFWRISEEDGSQMIQLPATFDAFRQSLSRSMKDNLAYYPRRLTRHGHAYQVLLLRRPEEVRARIDVLIDMHLRRAESIRGRPHGSHIPTDSHAEFLKGCLPRVAERSMITLAILEVDGKPVAAQAMLEAGSACAGFRQQVMYYSGYLQEWHDYSPITILASTAIRDAIARGFTHINFLPGDAPWKSRWGACEGGKIANVRGLRSQGASLTRVFLRSTNRRLSMK